MVFYRDEENFNGVIDKNNISKYNLAENDLLKIEK